MRIFKHKLTMAFSENILLLRKLSFKKLVNAFRVYRSFHLSRKSGTDKQKGFPISISIEPTTSCNLRCTECPSGLRSFSRPIGMLETNLFEKIINQLADKLIYLTFYFQGEPYLNPEFLKMVAIANRKKIFTSTSTNAHYLNDVNAKATIESGLDRLIISIDGTTQETYEQYRVGGDLSKVIEGTKNIVKWKRQLRSKTPQIIFQFLVVKPNEHQLEEVEQLANELGVDEVKFKTAQVYDFENGNPLIPENEQYARYKKGIDGKWRIKNELLNQCWRMWSSCVITWDGKIVPCCFDKDAKYQLGSLQQNSFEEIWQSKPYNEFRNSVLRSRKEIDICSNCSEGTKVWS
jgi:radical SAM protein with 4Fe4S-binding SPASM domain